MNSFPAVFNMALRPIPLISTYTSAQFFAVPAISSELCPASSPYLCPTTAPNLDVPTSSIRFVELSNVDKMRSADSNSRLVLPRLRGGSGGAGGCGDGERDADGLGDRLGGKGGFPLGKRWPECEA